MTHPRKHLLFVLLSAADLGLTCWLLAGSGGQVYEGNPVARWCLETLGWASLAGFKAAAVGAVLGLAVLVARSRPKAAGLLLVGGCAVTGGAGGDSASLLGVRAEEEAGLSQEEIDEEGNRRTSENSRRRAVFLARLSDDLASGQCTLREPGERVEGWDRWQDAEWRLCARRQAPGRPDAEVAAVVAMRHALVSLQVGSRNVRAEGSRAGRVCPDAAGSAVPYVRERFIP